MFAGVKFSLNSLLMQDRKNLNQQNIHPPPKKKAVMAAQYRSRLHLVVWLITASREDFLSLMHAANVIAVAIQHAVVILIDLW